MNEQLNEIKKDTKDIKDSIHRIELAHEARLSKLETKQTGIITISGLIFTGIITYILNFFQLKG